MGFSVIGCFRGRPQPHFTAGSVGAVGFWGTSEVGRGASSLSGPVGAFSLSSSVGTSSSSSSAGASSSSGLTLRVFSNRK